MEDGDGCEESLFSLELLVESARVEPRLLPTPMPASRPFRPAVALRLLDFPTLLVRAPHSVPGPLVPFGRGKSCLFRLRPSALKGLLRRSPLCALLLALPPGQGPARLLGTSSVSLAAAAEELLLGSGPGGRRGQFPLRDLMGELVGELGLSYRLSNLGPCLLGHLGQGAAPGEPHIKEQHRSEPHIEEQHRSSPRPLSVHSNRGINLELIPEGEEDQQDPAPEGGSTGSLSSALTERRPPSPAVVPEADKELEIATNVFCPPPMYYSRPAEIPCSTPKAAASVTVAAPRDPFPEEEIIFPSAEPIKEEPSSGVPEPASSSPVLSSPEQLRQTLSQLPLLNALLVELSLLSNQSLQPGPSTVHPQLAWLYQNVADGTKAPPSSVKSICPFREYKKPSPNHKDRGRSPSPKLKRNRPDHLKCMYPSMQVASPGKVLTKMERSGYLEKNNTKENSPHRRRLTYGLTNTLKLRLQRSNPGMLKVHEKREHRRKKQGDLSLERKGKSSSSKGKLLRSSPERHSKSSGQFDEKSISEEDAQINENVETLIQSSTDQDCSTTIKGLTCDLKKKVSARRVKSHENAKQKGLSEITGSSYKEKSLKVHLPRVSLQDTNALESKIDTEVEKCVPDNNWDSSSLHNDSQSNNFESSHGLKNLSDAVVSSENAAYSEDFTNVDSSGTALEAQESSSELLLINPNQSQSVMDSDSKMSERSITAESISPPVPVPSATSPIQSLKKTNDLKLNEKITDVALNELDHDDSSARASKEEPAAQQANEEGSKEMQSLEKEQAPSEINNNVEKGESSVEKSQSLRTSQVSSYLPSSVSDVDISGLEESNPSEKEKDDNFEMVDIANQCRHISELVVDQLPGYTM